MLGDYCRVLDSLEGYSREKTDILNIRRVGSYGSTDTGR